MTTQQVGRYRTVIHLTAKRTIKSTFIKVSYMNFSVQASVTVGKRMQIYLSPETTPKEYTKLDGTSYPKDEWNEHKNMRNVAAYLETYLYQHNMDVKITDLEYSDYGEMATREVLMALAKGRAKDAASWICDEEYGLYLALHTNASGSGTSKGTTARQNTRSSVKELANKLIAAVDAILPDMTGKNSTTAISDTNKYFDVMYPYKEGIPAILLESGYHDNPVEADFLIHNEKLLAETIGKTLVDHYYG